MSEQDLRKRLAGLNEEEEQATGKKPAIGPAKAAGLMGVGILLAGAVYFVSQPEAETDLDVRRASEFQTEGGGFGDLSRPRPPEPKPEPAPVETAEPPQSSDNQQVVELIRNLQDQIDKLAQAPNPDEAAPAPESSDALDELRDELTQLRADAEAREQELRDDLESRDLEIAGLNNDLDMMRLRSGDNLLPGSGGMTTEGPNEAEKQEAERRQSSMIAIGGGSSGAVNAAVNAAGFGDGAAAQDAARLSDDARFVRDAGRPASVQRAEIIVNPANTVTQGTMIQAVLETAIVSTLEGPIRGLVTTDVVSYDGSRILIPRGSRLIGSYSADVETGQNRLLVAWERIIMPDNQSVQISSFGGDALGRSGTTGKVNNHFFRRFGAAALISTISALPNIIEDEGSDGGVTISTGGSEATSGVTDALGGATESAIGKYVSMPPTISVSQGTRISVMVDRDLEIF
ncbi:TrbI/VirB10 family protein [Paracoccus sp. SM22M-07]|uniref:TrbI/VirB10 family protein n=1 Tax=Paracoccus sp. SM22M-07 TaxID=1520813 RepID=UPI00091B824F|nr:TrbI/VirB10 family protein [Paracoccus sp. SM22M-07]OJH43404.1 hypothetical protein IE00_16585 [Paracoccus sp. SM22M-07]